MQIARAVSWNLESHLNDREDDSEVYQNDGSDQVLIGSDKKTDGVEEKEAQWGWCNSYWGLQGTGILRMKTKRVEEDDEKEEEVFVSLIFFYQEVNLINVGSI